MRASIRGPISSPSWNAHTKSGQPARCIVVWLPVCRLTDQPRRNNAAKTRFDFAAPPNSCRLERDREELRNCLSKLQPLREDPQRESLHPCHRVSLGGPVCQDTGKSADLSEPAAVGLEFGSDEKGHGDLCRSVLL